MDFQAIIDCIRAVDGISLAAAKKKYFADLRTDEEDAHQHQRIIMHAQNITEEDQSRYTMLIEDDTSLS